MTVRVAKMMMRVIIVDSEGDYGDEDHGVALTVVEIMRLY